MLTILWMPCCPTKVTSRRGQTEEIAAMLSANGRHRLESTGQNRVRSTLRLSERWRPPLFARMTNPMFPSRTCDGYWSSPHLHRPINWCKVLSALCRRTWRYKNHRLLPAQSYPPRRDNTGPCVPRQPALPSVHIARFVRHCFLQHTPNHLPGKI